MVARMAHDVLAVLVSTIASESAFSAGGRTLNTFRTSLTPKIIDFITFSLYMYYELVCIFFVFVKYLTS